MPDSAPTLTRGQRLRLLAALQQIALFDTPAGPGLLVRDLPLALVATLVRSPIQFGDVVIV